MQKKQEKSSGEVSAENYFPVDEEDLKNTTEKAIKDIKPEKPKNTTEKVVKSAPSIEQVEQLGNKKTKRKYNPKKRKPTRKKSTAKSLLIMQSK